MLRTALCVEARLGAGEDRAVITPVEGGLLAIVADGAGGLGGGAQAADRAIAALVDALAAGSLSVSAIIAALSALDADLAAHPDAGELALALVGLSGERLVGASVGDCAAWLLGAEPVALTARQRRRPMLGSGAARITPFTAELTTGAVLLGSDGYFRYRGAGALAAPETPRLTAWLAAQVDQVRLKDGRLQDDVALIAIMREAQPPAKTRQPIEATAPAEPGLAGRTDAAGPRRLLFADRNAGFVRAVGRTMLGDAELTVVDAGGEALARALDGRFSAVLVDEALADMTGPELVTQLRGAGYAGPIIAISAREDRNQRMLDAGADAACSKMAFREIGEVLGRVLGG